MADRESRRPGQGDPGVRPEEPSLDRDEIARSRPRTPPGEYMREVRGELRKVAWPNRQEIVSYTIVVLVATLVLIGLIFVMDFVFGELIFLIYN